MMNGDKLINRKTGLQNRTQQKNSLSQDPTDQSSSSSSTVDHKRPYEKVSRQQSNPNERKLNGSSSSGGGRTDESFGRYSDGRDEEEDEDDDEIDDHHQSLRLLSSSSKLNNNQWKDEKKKKIDRLLDGAPGENEFCRYTRKDLVLILLIGLTAAYLRFNHISDPPAVVFDEVHFGKFTSYYIKREFFFDVHPPLAKLMLGLQGYLVGFNGDFAFENIGDEYLGHDVPYVALRSLSAVIGSITCCVVYAIMKESGYPAVACLFSAALIVFDNAHVLHTRLILLDAPLVFFLSCSLLSYIKFYKHRHVEFSKPWWKWLCLTGVALSLTLSCKMIGLFTFLTIGMAVLLDLWDMLDIRKGHSLDHIGKHFVARAGALIGLPFLIYLFWFWVHFKVLIYSGTGDEFMSSAFQESLIGSPLTMDSEDIWYNDTIILQHRSTKCFLHSHRQRYPLKYSDGRISSQGQQVTCYPHNDTNNHWIVEPTKPIPDSGRGRVVRHNDEIKLKHVNTGTYLYTHDVASPSMATNQEFTTTPAFTEDDKRFNETKFKVIIDDAHEGKQWKTKSGHFQLFHVATGVAMWTRLSPPLPDWGFGQQEVNGQRNLLDNTLLWVAHEIVRDNKSGPLIRPPPPKQKSVRKRSFLKKFLELQFAMLHYNSGLTESHPYASGPINWPFLLNGVSFWTGDPSTGKQVFMIGNVAGWWICVMCSSIILGVFGADQFARRRGISPIPFPVRNRLYKSGGFFLLAWAFHYFPFFLMGRQTFLHHYLPAHLCSALAAGMVFNFIITESVNHPISKLGPKTKKRSKTYSDVQSWSKSITMIIIIVLIGCFNFLSPFTYSEPGLNAAQINRRRILNTWTLHFAK